MSDSIDTKTNIPILYMMPNILEDIYKQAGLDEKEIHVYNTLLSTGTLTVLQLAQKSGQKRTNLYNILNSLEKLYLVKKVQENDTTKYYPNSPKEIQTLLNTKSNQINTAKNTFSLLIDSLESKYKLVSHKPAVTYLEGISGLQKLYDDILDTGQDILLFRSTHADQKKDVDELVQKQITGQVKRNIHTRVIGPVEDTSKETFLNLDKIRLVERRFTVNHPLRLPAQILIYGNKTAMTTIGEEIISTVVDNEDLTTTYRALFEFIWAYLTAETEEIINSWHQNSFQPDQNQQITSPDNIPQNEF